MAVVNVGFKCVVVFLYFSDPQARETVELFVKLTGSSMYILKAMSSAKA